MKSIARFFTAILLCLGFSAFAQTTPSATSPNYSGMWWSGSAESGWGMTLAHHRNASGNQMFGALYIYGQDGKPLWLVAPGGTFSQNGLRFDADLYVTTGTSYRNTYDPHALSITKVGTMSLSFVDESHAAMVYTVNGFSVQKTLEHFNFYAPPYDAWPNDYSDMWWGGVSENGWGFNIAQNSDQLFGVLYGYREDGSATWFVMPGGTWTSSKSFTANAYTTTGPAYTNPVFNPGNVTVSPVGTVTLLFNNRNSATLTYTLNCASTTRNVERLEFIANEGVNATMWNPPKLGAFVLAAGIAGCGGGGGGGSPPSVGQPAATVSITQVAPANTSANVAVDTKPTLSFTVANGSYLSHTADFRCGGNTVAYTSAVNGTAGTIALTPSASLPLGQTCQITWSVAGTPVGNPDAKITQVFTVVSQVIPRKLLLSIAAPSQNNRQSLMVVDLVTGVLSPVGISSTTSLGCEAGNLTANNLVRISCTLGASHWDYNPLANTVAQNTALTNLPTSTWSPVVSSPSGTDYYGTGANTGGGQVLVRNGNTFTSAIDISSKPLQYVAQVLGDFPSGKLYTLNQNLNQVSNPTTLPAHVDRIDISTNKVDATYSDTVPGIGLALYQGELYMAKYRDANGMDVVKFNATTFQKAGEARVNNPIGSGGRQFVYSIAVDANGVHLGIDSGIQTLSHDLKSIIRTAAVAQDRSIQDIFASNGKLYAIISSIATDNVLEIDSATGTLLHKWSVTGNPYRPAVIGN